MTTNYKTVTELNDDELLELKYAYFDQLSYDMDDDEMPRCPEEIPNEMILEHYAPFTFYPEDFACNGGDEDCGEWLAYV